VFIANKEIVTTEVSAHSVTEPLFATVATEHTLLSSDEQVLMQTATVEVENLQKPRRVTNRLLLDTAPKGPTSLMS